MGSACSVDEDARHHRENKKNRSNPTESYDTWQQKMLLDIGTDPIAVTRDFPRMIVYVGTETSHNYLPAGCPPRQPRNGAEDDDENGNGAAGPSRKPSENPLVTGRQSRSASFHPPPQDPSAAPLKKSSGRGFTHPSHPHHHTGSRHAPSPSQLPADGGHTSPGTRSQLGQRPSQREPFREDDVFGARMKRLREAVLLLSELCHERSTFGAAFEAAWDRLVHQGTKVEESDAVSDLLPPSPSPALPDGRPPTSMSAKKPARVALPLDVHQLLLNACVDSGMIALMDDASAAAGAAAGNGLPTSATLRAAVFSTFPPQPSHTSPIGASHISRRESSAPDSAFQLPPGNAATALTAGASSADYGATAEAAPPLENNTATATASKERPADPSGKNTAGKRQSSGGASGKESAAVAAMANPVKSNVHTPGSVNPTTTCGPAATSRYVVRSATFHLMQFTTQGVMFFPVQRLKHVLWVPWGTHMLDVSWTIHISLKDATPSDLIALKQHTLNALYNNASTVLPIESAAGAVATAAATGTTNAGRRASLSDTAIPTAAADEFGAAAASLALPELERLANANHGAPTPAAGAGVIQSGTTDAKSARKIVVIQHVQTGRHYVEDADKKTTPRYELDWACGIRIDQQALEETYAPFQRYAHLPDGASAATAAPPLFPRESKAEEIEEAFADMVTTTSPATGTADGIRVSQQPALLQREVIAATVEVVAARVQRPQRTLCTVSSTWKKRKEELEYVLEHQYKVNLEEVDELHEKRFY